MYVYASMGTYRTRMWVHKIYFNLCTFLMLYIRYTYTYVDVYVNIRCIRK